MFTFNSSRQRPEKSINGFTVVDDDDDDDKLEVSFKWINAVCCWTESRNSLTVSNVK